MCGICGIYDFSGKPVSEHDISGMLDIISYRGPDHKGMYVKENIGLGIQRLSIIDLSEKGNQPMMNEDKKVCVVFNGEIYNYRELRKVLVNKGHILEF